MRLMGKICLNITKEARLNITGGGEKTGEAKKDPQKREVLAEHGICVRFICICFLFSPKMKEIHLTQFNIHIFNFT